MKLYYYRHPAGNFGDDLNLWLWDRLVPGLLDGECWHDGARREENERESALFIGIGTILNDEVPLSPRKFVFGAGTGYGAAPFPDRSWHIYCVRGPLTAAALGLAPDLAVSDAAMLLGFVDLPPVERRFPLGYMPHVSVAEPWRELCAEMNLHFIDPSGGVEQTIAAIRSCEVVMAEAMHGAIAADALRVPWIAVRNYRHTNAFKWRDWCESVGLRYRPMFLGPIWPAEPDAGPARRLSLLGRRSAAIAGLKRAAARARPQLSPHPRFVEVTERLSERLERLREDHRSGRLAATDPARL